MAEYRFITSWQIEAPLQAVFDAVLDSLHWPDWWPGAREVTQLEQGDANGIGSLRRYTWQSLLGYGLRFDARAIRIAPPRVLEASVEGDLKGYGRWTFSHDKGITTVCYKWDVHTTRHWMNLLAPIARRVFAHSHHILMRRGAQGLARHLRARLIGVSQRELPRHSRTRGTAGGSMPVRWRAAALAGLLAGLVATAVQLLLWWATARQPVGMLLRDTRLAAAIVMGSSVLPPPATFDWSVMAAATTVHGVLSIAYGLLLGRMVAHLPMRSALLAGGILGLVIFFINMYGFTVLFPWFAVSRDWITAIAHLFFGMSAALIYKVSHDQQT